MALTKRTIKILLSFLVLQWTAFPVLGVPVPEGYYKYTVDVYTGFGAHDGTDSNVYVNLVGDKSETQPFRLDTPDRKVIICFVLYIPVTIM